MQTVSEQLEILELKRKANVRYKEFAEKIVSQHKINLRMIQGSLERAEELAAHWRRKVEENDAEIKRLMEIERNERAGDEWTGFQG
ncbi:hypothetical protein [Brevibacillus borstelensis]|uniref:hypothetical protein n=1 Tax=Brevibacillus borstelensis TaxID=45462 RepID=UPI0030F5B6F0